MNLPRLSVQNPVAVNLFTLLVVGVGAYYGLNLIREFFPTVDPEQIQIRVPVPGGAPGEIERTVTQRIEREIKDLDGVEKVSSQVFEGISVTILELEERTDQNTVLTDVRGAIDRVEPQLPDSAEEVEISLVRPFFPVISINVYGDVSEERLTEIARDVEDDLLSLKGISRLAVSGLRDRELWVEVEPHQLEEHGLTLEEVGRSISRTNLELAGGQIESPLGNVGVRTVGEETRAIELEDHIVVARPDGSAVRLGDLARLRDTFADRVQQGRFAGERAATMIVFKTPEDDALELAETVKEYVREHPTFAGGAVRLDTSAEISRFIEERIDLMLRNGLWGLVFVALTLILFLEFRIAWWVVAGIGISFLGTFVVMDWIGATINMISLFGLIVVLGLIVDDAIVIGENVHAKVREGMAPMQAAIEGAGQVALPVTTAVTTTIVAFLPLAYIDGVIGTFLRQLPLVVIAALSMSLVEAMIILPSHLGHPSRFGALLPGAVKRVAEAGSRVRHRIFERWLPDVYERVLRVCLRWRYVAVAGAVCIACWAGGLLAGGVVPFILFPESDAETIVIDVEMAAGTPEARTLEVIQFIEQTALVEAEVDRVTAVLGSSFSERGQETAADPATVGQVTLELVPAEQRQERELRHSTDLTYDLREKFSDITGATLVRVKPRAGGPGGQDIEMQVRGDDLEVLYEAVEAVRRRLETYDGVAEIEDNLKIGKIEARLELRPEARALGLTTADLGSQVRHALFGFEAQELQVGRDEVKVRVTLPESAREDLTLLGRLRVVTPDGMRVPLEEVAAIETGRGYASINRVDGDRAVTVTAEVDAQKSNTAVITEDLIAYSGGEFSETFPGVNIVFEGQRKQTVESLGSLKVGFPLALFMIYVVIAVLFRSYLQPLLVMIPIPFGFIGAILGHMILGFPFTMLSMIGGVALTGIIVNDSLILVDFINRFRGSRPLLEAVVAGGRGRLRAILLTTITTCAGLGPLLLETSFQAQFLIPMAVSIVFGLAFGTVWILLLLPVLYAILEDTRIFVRRTLYTPESLNPVLVEEPVR